MARILLVEDNETVRFALTALLRESGHSVTEAPDGNAAIAALSEARPEVVVTDVFMPALDGIELICALRETHPDLKIVAMSGGGSFLNSTAAVGLAEKLGADVVMQKPVDNDTLLARIEELIQAAA